MVATDSRATAGSHIATTTVKKVIQVNKYLLGTMAGGAADCQYWMSVLRQQCKLYELRTDREQRLSTAAASKLMSNILYQYKGYGLSLGSMICGWDAYKGPGLFYIDDDGTRLTSHMFSVGSGSPFAYGVLDAGYKPDLTDQEALELAVNAIYVAGFKDSMSGNFVNLWQINEDGCRQVDWIDLKDIYKRVMEKESEA